MSPITHFLASWSLAENFGESRRERSWICFAGVAPDLDGLGIIGDLTNHALGRPESLWFATYHHFLFHGFFGALLFMAAAAVGGVRRWQTLLLVFISLHLHLACDLVGARGPTPDEIWPIHYFAPFSNAWTFSWNQQWALNAWPNFVITSLLILWAIYRAVHRGFSPFEIFSPRLNAIVVTALRNRWHGSSWT
jgi:inner membrane protein